MNEPAKNEEERMSLPAEKEMTEIPMDTLGAPTPLFRSHGGMPVAIQLVDAAQRITELESELRKAKRASSYRHHEAHEERLRLRVALQEQREWMDFERYRLEKLAEVARLPWWRFSKKRSLLNQLEDDLRSVG